MSKHRKQRERHIRDDEQMAIGRHLLNLFKLPPERREAAVYEYACVLYRCYIPTDVRHYRPTAPVAPHPHHE